MEVTIGDLIVYADQYEVVSGENLYVLTVTSGDKSYLTSQEVKRTIDSFTIKNFRPVDTSPIVSDVVKVVGAIILVVFIVVAVIKLNDARKVKKHLKNPTVKNYKVSSEPINLDEYNVGYSGEGNNNKNYEPNNINESNAYRKPVYHTIDSFVNNNANRATSPTPPHKKENTNNYINYNNSDINYLPMNWYNFWVSVRIPLGIIFSIIGIAGVLATSFGEFPTMSLIFVILTGIQIWYFVFIRNIMKNKPKGGFTHIVIALMLDVVFMSINSMLNTTTGDVEFSTLIVAFIISMLIWFWPNYVYFSKRKYIFEN